MRRTRSGAPEARRIEIEGNTLLRKRFAATLVALAVTLGAVFGLGSPAAAIESDVAVDADWYTADRECIETTYVSGCVQPEGDILWVKDNVANSRSVSLAWTDLDSGRSGSCYDNLGTAKAWVICNKDFTEGHRIQWQVGWQISADWGWSRTETTTV
ncbi:MAG TPA: hypothetical protein VGE61_06635 [Glycomyces sp.]